MKIADTSNSPKSLRALLLTNKFQNYEKIKIQKKGAQACFQTQGQRSKTLHPCFSWWYPFIILSIMAQCQSPESFARPNGKGSKDRITVPCGKCGDCLANEKRLWEIRIREENKDSVTAFFITLTCKEPDEANLSKSKIQAFLKRLRTNLSFGYYDTREGEKVPQIAPEGPNLRYFICGEYGGTTSRPHYHMILWNMPRVYSDPNFQKDWVNRQISKAWQDGFIHVGNVTDASIGYTLKYVMKSQDVPEGREPPFRLMSKGIGRRYIEKMAQYHQDTGSIEYTEIGGRKSNLPRYFKNQIFNDYQKRKISLKFQVEKDKKEILLREKLKKLNDDYGEVQIMIHEKKKTKLLETKIRKQKL